MKINTCTCINETTTTCKCNTQQHTYLWYQNSENTVLFISVYVTPNAQIFQYRVQYHLNSIICMYMYMCMFNYRKAFLG